MCLARMSAAGICRQAPMDGFTQHLNSIVHWLWLTILGSLGAGFTAFLSGTGIVLSIEKLNKGCKSANFHSNVHEDLAIVPANESSMRREGTVTRPTGRREYVHVGSTAAFPAADACQSSNRPLSGTGIVLSIEKLDKECKSANFHSKISETAQTGNCSGQGVLHVD